MKTTLLSLFASAAFFCSAVPVLAQAPQGATAAKQQKISEDSQRVLSRLYETTPGSRELVDKSRGMLVFPTVLSAGESTGGQYGEGALFVGGKATGLYSAKGINLGPQYGAKSKAIVILFLAQDQLDRFRAADAWTAGKDAATLKRTASGGIDTNMGSASVIGFAVTNAGAMFDASIVGTKVERLTP